MEEIPIRIRTVTIRLDQALKLSRVVGTGGQAKLLIQGGEVQVNGREERRRGRQLKDGDVVEVRGAGRFRIEQS